MVAQLQEKCHCIVDIPSHRWMGIEGSRRQQNNVVAGCEDLWEKRLVHQRALRTTFLNERVTIPTKGHQGVDSRLHQPRGGVHGAGLHEPHPQTRALRHRFATTWGP